MNEAKDKDRILSQIKAFKKPYEIADLSKYLYDLENDGYVKVTRDAEKKPIMLRLTNNGETFVDSGGYTARHKSERKSKLSAKAIAVIGFVAGAIIMKLIDILAEWLCK